MQGRIIKGIAGFYYVYVVGSGVYECKAKGIFRKEKKKPLVGDLVEISVLDEAAKEGNLDVDSASEKRTDSSGFGKCGSGVGGVCSDKTKASFSFTGSVSGDDGT